MGAKGGSLFAVLYGILLFVNHFKKTLTHTAVGSEYIFSCKKCWMEDSNFMRRFGYDLDAFRSVCAERLLNFAQVFNKFYSF